MRRRRRRGRRHDDRPPARLVYACARPVTALAVCSRRLRAKRRGKGRWLARAPQPRGRVPDLVTTCSPQSRWLHPVRVVRATVVFPFDRMTVPQEADLPLSVGETAAGTACRKPPAARVEDPARAPWSWPPDTREGSLPAIPRAKVHGPSADVAKRWPRERQRATA